jgi:hypothetical protein
VSSESEAETAGYINEMQSIGFGSYCNGNWDLERNPSVMSPISAFYLCRKIPLKSVNSPQTTILNAPIFVRD